MLARVLAMVQLVFVVVALAADEPPVVSPPLGLPELPVPEDNRLTHGKVELGKQLFFDPRLSRDNTISCAACHDPTKGWSNGQRFATGIDGQVTGRSVPSLINTGYQHAYFWDGRVETLEQLVPHPIEDPTEMGLPMEQLVAKLNEIPGYQQQFREVFDDDARPENITQAIASFVRTIVSANSPYDRFRAGDLSALSPAARRGHDVFFFRANCSACHRGPNLTDGKFHNVGIGMDAPDPDLGRIAVNKDPMHTGSFKTPTLRDLSRTAPYMHDGSFETLEEVVDYYNQGGFMHGHLSGKINTLLLSDKEKVDLVVFLEEGLTSNSYPTVVPPELPNDQ